MSRGDCWLSWLHIFSSAAEIGNIERAGMSQEEKVNDAFSFGPIGFEMPVGPPRNTDRNLYV